MEVGAEWSVEACGAGVEADAVAEGVAEVPEEERLMSACGVAVGEEPGSIGGDGAMSVDGEVSEGQGRGAGVVLVGDEEVGVLEDAAHEEARFSEGVVEGFEGASRQSGERSRPGIEEFSSSGPGDEGVVVEPVVVRDEALEEESEVGAVNPDGEESGVLDAVVAEEALEEAEAGTVAVEEGVVEVVDGCGGGEWGGLVLDELSDGDEEMASAGAEVEAVEAVVVGGGVVDGGVGESGVAVFGATGGESCEGEGGGGDAVGGEGGDGVVEVGEASSVVVEDPGGEAVGFGPDIEDDA